MTNQWAGLLDVLRYVGKLKHLQRQGWVYIGVDEPESVAEHSFRVAMLVLMLGQRDGQIDLARALTLALVHDLPEAIAGDATPFDHQLGDETIDQQALFRSKPEYSPEADARKRVAEERAIREITRRLPDSEGRAIVGAWEEYEQQATPEAQLVRQADKLEALLQALEYRERQPDLPIESFRLGTEAAVTNPSLRELLAALVDHDEHRSR